jgi:ABC-type xylose transport system permease subunit
MGSVIVAGMTSLLNVWETTYLLVKIYSYISRSKKHNIQLRIPKFTEFTMGLILILALDWFGIYLFNSNGVNVIEYSFEVLHLRCILMVYIFVQLRDITFGHSHKSNKKLTDKVPEPAVTVKVKDVEDTIILGD